MLDGNYSTRLEIRSGTELKGALGAYSATGTTGQPIVYLNGNWLSTASAEQIQSVLLEELGHSFDDQINGGIDSAGDEGAIFSALERIYDKRRPYQKTRLSEIEISQQLDRICAGLPVSVNAPSKDSGLVQGQKL